MAKTDEFGGVPAIADEPDWTNHPDSDQFGGLPEGHPDLPPQGYHRDEFGGEPILDGPAAPPNYWTLNAQPPVLPSAGEMLSGRPVVAPVGQTGADVSPIAQIASGYSALPPSPEPAAGFDMDRELARMREHWGPSWTLDDAGNPVPSPETVADMARTGTSKLAAIPYEIAGGTTRAVGAGLSAAGGENPFAGLTAAQIRERRERLQSDLDDAIDDYTNASRGQKMRVLPNGLSVPAENPTDEQTRALAKVFSAEAALNKIREGSQEPEGTLAQLSRDLGRGGQADADTMAESERLNNAAIQPNPKPEWRTSLGNRFVGGAVDAASMAGQGALGAPGMLTLAAGAFEKSYQRAMDEVPPEIAADPVKLAQYKQSAQSEAAKEAIEMTVQMGSYHLSNLGAATALARYAPDAGLVAKGMAGTAANMAASAANRAASGQPIAPGLEGTMADAALALVGVKQHSEMARMAKAESEARAKGALPDTPEMAESLDLAAQAKQKVVDAMKQGQTVAPANEFDSIIDRLAYFGHTGEPVVIQPGERIDVFEHIAKLPGNDVNPQVGTLPDGRRILYDPTLQDEQGKPLTPDLDAAANHLGLDLTPRETPAEHPEAAAPGAATPATAPEPAEPYVGPGSREYRQGELEQAFAPDNAALAPQAADQLRAKLAAQQRVGAQQAMMRRLLDLQRGGAADPRAAYENAWAQMLAQREEGRQGSDAETSMAAQALRAKLAREANQNPRTGAPRAESSARAEPPTGAPEVEPSTIDPAEHGRLLKETETLLSNASPEDPNYKKVARGIRLYRDNMADAIAFGDIEAVSQMGTKIRELNEMAKNLGEKPASWGKPEEPAAAARTQAEIDEEARLARGGRPAGQPPTDWMAAYEASKRAEALANLEQQQGGRLSPADRRAQAEAKLSDEVRKFRADVMPPRPEEKTDYQLARLLRQAQAAGDEENAQHIQRIQYEREQLAESRGGVGGNELIDTIKKLGGLPTKEMRSDRANGWGGELDSVLDGGQFSGLLSKRARRTPSQLLEGLQSAGFDFDTIGDLTDALHRVAIGGEERSTRAEGHSEHQDYYQSKEDEQSGTLFDNDLFGGKEPTPEEAAAARQRREQADEVAERQAKKLEAKDLDTTGDLFGGGDLFSARADKAGELPTTMKAADYPPPRGNEPDLVLLGCGKSKQDTTGGAVAAADLYTGPLFLARRAFAESQKRPWMIVSAEHGMMPPGLRIHTYDKRIDELSPEEKQMWRQDVRDEIEKYFGSDTQGKTVELHAGDEYVKEFKAATQGLGLTVTEPMKGRGIGSQLREYSLGNVQRGVDQSARDRESSRQLAEQRANLAREPLSEGQQARRAALDQLARDREERAAKQLADRDQGDLFTKEDANQYMMKMDVPESKRPEGEKRMTQLEQNSDKPYAGEQKTKQAAAYRALKAADVAGVRSAIAAGTPLSRLLVAYAQRAVRPFNIRGAIIKSPRDLAAHALAHRTPFFESLKLAVLDDRMQVIHSQLVSVGTVNESLAHPREMLAIIADARRLNPEAKLSGWVITHNHPSGDVTPSEADHRLTRRLDEVGNLTKLPLLDHVITNGEKYYSFREVGVIAGAGTGGAKPSRGKPRLPILETPEGPMERATADYEATPGSEKIRLGSGDELRRVAQTMRTADPDAIHVLNLDTRYGIISVDRHPVDAHPGDIIQQSSDQGTFAFAISMPKEQGRTAATWSERDHRFMRRMAEASGLSQITFLDMHVEGTPQTAKEFGMLEEPGKYSLRGRENQADSSHGNAPELQRTTPEDHASAEAGARGSELSSGEQSADRIGPAGSGEAGERQPGELADAGAKGERRGVSANDIQDRAGVRALDADFNRRGGRRDQLQGIVRRMGGGDTLFDERPDRNAVGFKPDGTLSFSLARTPHELLFDRGYSADQVKARFEKSVSEEMVHFAQMAVLRDEWRASDRSKPFPEWARGRFQEIYDDIRQTASALRRKGLSQRADEIEQQLADAANIYHGGEDVLHRMMMGDNHIPELLRQLIQAKRELGPTEQLTYLHPLLEHLRDWAMKIVSKMRGAYDSAKGGEWGPALKRAIDDTEARLEGRTTPSEAEGGTIYDALEERASRLHEATPEVAEEEKRKTFAQRNAEHDARKAAFDQLSHDEKMDLANENIEAQNPRRNVLAATGADVGQHVRAAATGIHAAVKSVADFLNPAGASEAAGATARNIREQNARADREAAIAREALKKAEKAVDKLDPKRSLAAMDAIETGKVSEDHELRPIVDAMKAGYDKRIAMIRRLVPGAMEHLIKDYLVHLWKDPKAAEEFYNETLGVPDRENASLEGSKGFMKKRTIPTTLDGVAWRSEKYPNGMEPLSWNFVKMTRLKYQEMDRFIMGQKIFGEERRSGRAVFVPADGHAPAGTVPIDDKIARVYAPPWVEVPEFNDPLVTEKLGALVDQLGFKHRRGWRLSEKGGSAGIAYMERGRMETKHNTPESVVEHELGHLLDGKYGIWQALTRPPGQETVTLTKGPREGETVTRTRRTPKDETQARVAINKELRALADLRMENIEDKVSGHFKKYIRNKEEKIANAVMAMIYAPDRMQEIAPTVLKNLREFIASKPELKPLLEIRNSLRMGENTNRMPLKGHRLLGQYYAPAESARVLNNFLAPGFQGAPVYDALRTSANLLNAAQLGWSGFHAGFVALDTTLSKFSLALMQASQGGQDIFAGRFGKGLRNIGSAAKNAAEFGAGIGTLGLYSVGRAARIGSQMIKEYEKPGSVGGVVGEMVDKAMMGGWAPHMDQQYRIGAMQGFREAVKDGRYFTAAMKSPLAAVEMGMYPIMEMLVPRMKAAVLYDMMKWEAREMPKDVTPDQVRQIAARVSDHVDNRLGQLRYDNLFLNKKFKDALMLAQRSLGWNLGTLRELGGGIASAADMPGRLKRGERMMTHDTAYLLSILAGVPMMGALYQYLHTGQLPQDEKDLFAPRTGRMMPDGTPERVMLPSYAKDLHSYGVHPGQTIVNKLNPLWNSLISALWTNKDFYGTQVRDPNASAATQAGQLAKFGAKQFLPFSYTAAGRRVAGPGSGIESFFGIQPAPADIRRSPAQNLISEYFQSKGAAGAVTPEAKADKDTARAVSDILRNNAYQLPPDVRARLDELPVAAQIRALKEGTSTPMQLAFKLLPLDVAEQVYQAATPREREQLESLLEKKRENAEKKKASQGRQLEKLKSGLE